MLLNTIHLPVSTVHGEIIVAGIIAIAGLFKKIYKFLGYGKARGTIAVDRLTYNILKEGLTSIKVFLEFRGRKFITKLMAVSMRCHFMATSLYFLHKARKTFSYPTKHKESR